MVPAPRDRFEPKVFQSLEILRRIARFRNPGAPWERLGARPGHLAAAPVAGGVAPEAGSDCPWCAFGVFALWDFLVVALDFAVVASATFAVAAGAAAGVFGAAAAGAVVTEAGAAAVAGACARAVAAVAEASRAIRSLFISKRSSSDVMSTRNACVGAHNVPITRGVDTPGGRAF